MENDEFRFTLSKPFTYAMKGDELEATYITLTAPTSKNLKECSFLKQSFFRAMSDLPDAKGDQDASKDTIEGDDVMVMISMSKSVALEEVLVVSRKLFSSGVAFVEGEVPLTGSLLNGMTMEDLEKMTGEYMVFFTLRSSLEKLRNN